MIEIISIVVACLALIISAVTAWLTLLQKGTVRMTQPTLLYFGPDGSGGPPKVYLRTLLYCTAKRGRIVENMYLKLRRGEFTQTFNVWVYGDSSSLARGSGLFVGESGVTCNHHFLLPRDGTHFEFLPGEYRVEVYASLVGASHSLLLNEVKLALSEGQASAMKDKLAGVFFDWGPDSGRYHAHIDDRRKFPPTVESILVVGDINLPS